MSVALVAARAANGVIGVEGRLPWRLPDDLRRFKRLTMGHTLVMGRRTWDSIGRPLPGRQTIVLSRNQDLTIAGVTVVHDLASAYGAATGDVFVVGGAAVYAAALPDAARLHLTEVHAEVDGDVRFPHVDLSTWTLVREEHHPADASHPFAFTFRDYAR